MEFTNTCTFQGRLLKKPAAELHQTESGALVCNLTLFIKTLVKNKAGEPYEKTDFAQIIFWDHLAQEAAQLPKGALVQITGRMQSRRYQVGGTFRYVTEFVALSLTALALPEKQRA